MIVEKEAFDKLLSPLYQKEIEKLEKEYAAISEDEIFVKKECLFKFYEKYLMIPEIWNEYLRMSDKSLANGSTKVFEDQWDDFKRARNQFFNKSENGFTKLLHRQSTFSDDKFFLDYSEVIYILNLPCNALDKTWRMLDCISCKPLPVDAFLLYEKTKALYSKIFAAKMDDEKWAYFVSQVKDNEYVEHNFENRIGKNLNSQKLWKLYFQYLEKNNTKRLLYMYSCYCRFFIEDNEIKNAYKNATLKYGPSLVHWKNLFSFETFKEEIFIRGTTSFSSSKYQPPKSDDVMTKFSTNFCSSQTFSLPKVQILYLLEKGKPKIIHNLHKSCKYFFIIFPHPIYHKLCFGDWSHNRRRNYVEYFQQSARISTISSQPFNFTFKHKFIISNSLSYSNYRRDASRVITSCIFRCYAKFLNIYEQDLTFEEYKILTAEGYVEKLVFTNTYIFNEKKEEVDLADIFRLTPKLIDIYIQKASKVTFDNTAELNFHHKFKSFVLYSAGITCEPYAMVEFLKAHFDQDSKFELFFDRTSPIETGDRIVEVVKNELTNFWTKKDDQPYISFCYHRKFCEIFRSRIIPSE